MKKIFLSCVSSELKSYRLALANHLAAAKGGAFEIKVEEDFQQNGFTRLEQLADYVRGCDHFIHPVGDASGTRPQPDQVRTLLSSLGETATDPLTEWSYTQWEYRLAERFGRPALIYIAKSDAPRDCLFPIQQSDDDARLQETHRAHLAKLGKHYWEFSNLTGLVRQAFYDLGLNPETVKVITLPFKSLGRLFKGRRGLLPADSRSPGTR